MATVREAVETLEAARNVQRASDPGAALAQAAEDGTLKMTPVLAALGLDPSKPAHQAALLICNKYGLDPLLKHVVVINGAGAYITRDGLLHVAHMSGQFDGITIGDVIDAGSHWTTTASVYRKDMSRPFTYPGRYPKSGSNKAYGPEMAVKTAEVMALRRAFDVSLPAFEERHAPNDAGPYVIEDDDDGGTPDDDEPVQGELVEP
jgi:hypothetical protein